MPVTRRPLSARCRKGPKETPNPKPTTFGMLSPGLGFRVPCVKLATPEHHKSHTTHNRKAKSFVPESEVLNWGFGRQQWLRSLGTQKEREVLKALNDNASNNNNKS